MGDRMGDDRTHAERRSDLDLVVTRVFEAPLHLVYQAWTRAELFQQWWAPRSMGVPILSCEMDVRTGGGYRIVFGTDPAQSMTFFGRYLEVAPQARMVWTNDECGEGAVTTVTFEAHRDGTRVVLHEAYPSRAALDEVFEGMAYTMSEQFRQLDELLAQRA